MATTRPLLTTVSQVGLLAGIAVAASTLPQAARAQEAPAQQSSEVALPAVTVEGAQESPPNTLEDRSSINRLPGTVQDQPQVINVVPQEIMQQQGVTTLDEALRNVPGITVSIGEGGGGQNGDQFRIRGFEARGDIYLDGLRDFGVYTRDSFNTEEVQVIKGPSGGAFGMGTVGGAINTSSKMPYLEDFYAGTLSGGSGPLGRLTVDVNRQVSDTIAVRMNAMATHQDSPERDRVKSHRWGFAPSIAVGLGTDTTWNLGYLLQHDERVPDYGVPVVTKPGSNTGKPVTEHGVDRSNWYGTQTDKDNTTVNVLTSNLRHEFTDSITLFNDTRLGFYERTFAATPASCPAACVTALFDGDASTEPMINRGGPGPYKQNSWGTQNITTGVAEFETGGFRHQLVTGVDLFYQSDHRRSQSYSPSRTGTSLLDPSHYADYDIVPSTSASARKDGDAQNVGLFASDRFWFTEEISLLAGIRWDGYWADYSTEGPTSKNSVSSNSNQYNPRASLIWEPTQYQTYYASYAQSTSPQGQYIISAPTPLNDEQSDLDPEKNTIYEVGAKIGLFEGKLGVYGSLFYVKKDNATETDPLTGDIISSGDKQRNRGIELGVTGLITPSWVVNANYTYMDSETLDSANADRVGKDVQYVPHNAASLWTTYDLKKDLALDSSLLVGGGFTYRDGVYLNANNTSKVPYNLSLDGVVSYEINEHATVSLNGYNLTDHDNYAQLFGNRVVPGPGRTFLVSMGVKF